jgi:hypothetical protein
MTGCVIFLQPTGLIQWILGCMKIALWEQAGTTILCLSFIIAAGDTLGDDIHKSSGEGLKIRKKMRSPFVELSFSLSLSLGLT